MFLIYNLIYNLGIQFFLIIDINQLPACRLTLGSSNALYHSKQILNRRLTCLLSLAVTFDRQSTRLSQHFVVTAIMTKKRWRRK